MARAKRTDRAEARRRYRTEMNAAAAADADDESVEESADRPDAHARTSVAPGRGPARAVARVGFLAALRTAYAVADVRADIRSLPDLLRGRAFIVPGGLIVATLVLAIATAKIPNVITALVVALFLGPLPIGAIYAAGTLSPRASYLMGAIASFLGTLGLVVYSIVVTGSLPSAGDLGYAFAFYTLFGGVIGAGLGFYRRLLRTLNPTAGQRPPQRPRPNAKAGAKAR